MYVCTTIPPIRSRFEPLSLARNPHLSSSSAEPIASTKHPFPREWHAKPAILRYLDSAPSFRAVPLQKRPMISSPPPISACRTVPQRSRHFPAAAAAAKQRTPGKNRLCSLPTNQVRKEPDRLLCRSTSSTRAQSPRSQASDEVTDLCARRARLPRIAVFRKNLSIPNEVICRCQCKSLL